MPKFTVDKSGLPKLPITITVDLGRFATGVRDLSVAEARALCDQIHDLCDQVEATNASA